MCLPQSVESLPLNQLCVCVEEIVLCVCVCVCHVYPLGMSHLVLRNMVKSREQRNHTIEKKCGFI